MGWEFQRVLEAYLDRYLLKKVDPALTNKIHKGVKK